MGKAIIKVDTDNALKESYKLRTVGMAGTAVEITIPRVALRREAERLGLTLEQFLEQYKGEWLFNDFHGLHLNFKKNGPK